MRGKGITSVNHNHIFNNPLTLLTMFKKTLFVMFALCAIVSGYVHLIPPATAAVSYCSMNPHRCVSTIVNTVQHMQDMRDHFEEAQKQQRRMEEQSKENAQKMRQYNINFPTDPWGVMGQMRH